MKRKNKILLIIASLVLLIFIYVGTYSWYLYFLKESDKFVTNSRNETIIGDITLDDNGNILNIKDATSIDDDEINSVVPYSFDIKNNSNKDSNYVLYIEDLPLNSINDGCTSSTLLNRNQLKYQLKLDDKLIKEDYLDNVKDNILDTRIIKSKEIYKYQLRIYIHDEAEDWLGKHYHYRVVLNKKEEK